MISPAKTHQIFQNHYIYFRKGWKMMSCIVWTRLQKNQIQLNEKQRFSRNKKKSVKKENWKKSVQISLSISSGFSVRDLRISSVIFYWQKKNVFVEHDFKFPDLSHKIVWKLIPSRLDKRHQILGHLQRNCFENGQKFCDFDGHWGDRDLLLQVSQF